MLTNEDLLTTKIENTLDKNVPHLTTQANRSQINYAVKYSALFL